MTKAPSRLTSLLWSSGLFATLRGPLGTKGTGASKIGRGLVLSVLATTLGVLSFAAAPALAAAPEAPVTVEPAEIRGTTAVLQGVVNPIKAATVSWFFEYKAGSVCTGGTTTPVEGPAEVEALPVAVKIENLTPGTEYAVCLVAEVSPTEKTSSAAVEFTTKTPTIEEQFLTRATSTSATLNATINPQGTPAGYRFEYSSGGGAYQPVAAGEGTLGEGTAGVHVKVELEGLTPETTYSYRVSATYAGGTVAGEPPATFTTQSSSASTALPDNRQYEMVSPPNKHGAAIEGLGRSLENSGLVQAAEGGGAIAYLADGSIVEGAAGNQAPSLSQVFSRRGSAGGWSSQDLATPHESTVTVGFARAEYDLFSSDLSVGLVEPKGETPLPPLEKGAERTLYLRNDESGSYLPLVTTANTPAGSKLGHEGEPAALRFEGASSDLSRVVLSSSEALTENAVNSSTSSSFAPNLYEWAAGRLQLVSLLPPNAEGKELPASTEHAGSEFFASSLGYGIDKHGVFSRRAVSSDGSRVVWTATAGGTSHLYVRDVARGVSMQVDAVQPGAEGVGPAEEYGDEPVFQVASADGSLVFFTDTERLTVGSHAGTTSLGGGEYGSPDLYVFDVSSGVLRDLTPEGEGVAGESANVEGAVLGASEDGSYVYFAAKGVFAEGAVSSANNLYVDHESGGVWEKPRFIGDLTDRDIEGDLASDGQGAFNRRLPAQYLVSRVSPDGRFVAFMSDASLTGYDNRDAVTGVPDEEVYLYEAGSGRLVCASCDPSGARPVGGGGGRLVEPDETWFGQGSPATLAGSIPAWSWASNADSRTDYQSRFLEDGGRLFFNSPVGLVPGDVNGTWDVYEFEPAGVGSCEAGVSSASVVYSAADDGCVGLISSGTSGDESVFMDASASGGDVFFLTSAQLAAEDVDGAFDVYDAHECTNDSPCPSPGVVSPPCSTAEGCRASGSVPVFGSPASESFAGQGNIAPPASAIPKRVTKKAVRCKRSFVKKKIKKKEECVKAKAKKKTKRAGHEGRAK